MRYRVICWTQQDQDQEEYRYAVQYSPDAGATWIKHSPLTWRSAKGAIAYAKSLVQQEDVVVWTSHEEVFND